MNRLWVSNTALQKSLYVIGRAGSGKTNLINWIVAQRMWGKQGVSQLEPHGDSVQENLGRVPPWAIDDTIYFDPSEADCPALNIYALPSPPDKLARDIGAFFRKRNADAWGPRLDHILLHVNHLLITDMQDNAGDSAQRQNLHAFCDSYRLLTDAAYRKPIVERTKRASEAAFWGEGGEFATLPKGATAPVLNKLSGLFLSGSLTERIFSRVENDIILPDILDNRKNFLVNLSRGKLGEDVSSFLGALLSEGLTAAAFARASISESHRKWHTVAADEFQAFQSSSIADVLSQTRKYALSLVMSHQYISQLDTELQNAIFANVNAIVCFRVDEKDAQVVTKKMQCVREFVRKRGRGETYSFAEECAEVADTLRNAYLAYDTRQMELDTHGVEILNYRHIRNDIYNALHAVLSPRCTPTALKEIMQQEFGGAVRLGGVRLFPDVEITAEPYPSVHDLVNLPPYTAFVRVDKTSNVRKFRTLPCPPPDPKIAEAIKKRNRARYEERLKKQNAERRPYAVREMPAHGEPEVTDTPPPPKSSGEKQPELLSHGQAPQQKTTKKTTAKAKPAPPPQPATVQAEADDEPASYWQK